MKSKILLRWIKAFGFIVGLLIFGLLDPFKDNLGSAIAFSILLACYLIELFKGELK